MTAEVIRLGDAPDTFTACTWNAYHGSTRDQLDPILDRIMARGTSVLFVQELPHDWSAEWLRSHGLRSVRLGQYVVAWDEKQWTRLAAGGLRLSDVAYEKRGGGDQFSESTWAVLADGRGRTLTALSYHLPAHIQVAEDKRPDGRYRAALESVATMQHVAAEAVTTACLFAGDDNVDELHGIGAGDGTWRTWFGGPLRWVRSPDPTFGHRRKIDDHAQTGLRPMGDGWTLEGTPAETPSHRPFGHRYRWAD